MHSLNRRGLSDLCLRLPVGCFSESSLVIEMHEMHAGEEELRSLSLSPVSRAFGDRGGEKRPTQAVREHVAAASTEPWVEQMWSHLWTVRSALCAKPVVRTVAACEAKEVVSKSKRMLTCFDDTLVVVVVSRRTRAFALVRGCGRL
eukprot:63411-Pyramimonas_sp.AAC.2